MIFTCPQVKTILEGSVRKSGNRLRITAQLINAADGCHLWSELYDREMKDIFDVQDEITLAVVDALKVKLLGEEQGAVLKRHTRNREAHEFYLRGLFYFNRFTPDDFQKASESFRRFPVYAGHAICRHVSSRPAEFHNQPAHGSCRQTTLICSSLLLIPLMCCDMRIDLVSGRLSFCIQILKHRFVICSRFCKPHIGS